MLRASCPELLWLFRQMVRPVGARDTAARKPHTALPWCRAGREVGVCVRMLAACLRTAVCHRLGRGIGKGGEGSECQVLASTCPMETWPGWAVLLSTGNSKGQDGRWRHRWELALGYPGPFHLLTREQKDGRTVGIARSVAPSPHWVAGTRPCCAVETRRGAWWWLQVSSPKEEPVEL